MDINLLRESFAKAVPLAGEIADSFYETLFADFPGSDQLFADTSMEKQKKLLINSLVYIVDHADKHEKLVPYLKAMGARHIGYGTQPEHYSWVGQSLLKTFKKHLGDEWTSEVNNTWVDAYNTVASIMQEGAKEHSDQQNNTLSDNKPEASEQGHEQVNLPDQVVASIQEKARQDVKKAVEKIYSEAFEKELKKYIA